MAQSNHQRARPDEFEVVFIERGRLECETYFRAGRNTITRWLEESGKARLIRKRKQYVKSRAALEREARTPQKATPPPAAREDPEIAALAARHLQRKQAGSWVVYEIEAGWWMVGTVKRTEREMIAKAERKGFSVKRAREQIAAFPLNRRSR